MDNWILSWSLRETYWVENFNQIFWHFTLFTICSRSRSVRNLHFAGCCHKDSHPKPTWKIFCKVYRCWPSPASALSCWQNCGPFDFQLENFWNDSHQLSINCFKIISKVHCQNRFWGLNNLNVLLKILLRSYLIILSISLVKHE